MLIKETAILNALILKNPYEITTANMLLNNNKSRTPKHHITNH